VNNITGLLLAKPREPRSIGGTLQNARRSGAEFRDIEACPSQFCAKCNSGLHGAADHRQPGLSGGRRWV